MSTRFLSKLGHVGSKTRSQGQFKGKPCEHSRGHSFDLILNKLTQLLLILVRYLFFVQLISRALTLPLTLTLLTLMWPLP